MTSGLDPRCFIQYTYTTKWQVFFYGLQKNLTDTSSESIILNGILGDLLGNLPFLSIFVVFSNISPS